MNAFHYKINLINKYSNEIHTNNKSTLKIISFYHSSSIISLSNPTSPTHPESSPHQSSHSSPTSSANTPPLCSKTSSLCTRTTRSPHSHTSSQPSASDRTQEINICASMNIPMFIELRLSLSCCQCKRLERILACRPRSWMSWTLSTSPDCTGRFGSRGASQKRILLSGLCPSWSRKCNCFEPRPDPCWNGLSPCC